MRLLLDEHYADEIAQRLRDASHNAETVSEHGLKGLEDEALLVMCAAAGRALLTNNARDFVPLARAWSAAGREHAGVLLTADASMACYRDGIGRYVAVLTALMEAHPGERELTDQVRWLP